jgi:hypothetical protein
MRKEIIERTLYKFNELSESSQRNAIDNLIDINISHDWYEDDYSYLEDLHGIRITKGFYFDIGRSWYIVPRDIRLIDVKKFAGSLAGKDSILLAGDFALGISHNTRNGKAIVESHYRGSYRPRLERAIFALQELLQGKLDAILEQVLTDLSNQYCYLMTDEAIKETIEANDYEFTEEGRLA